MAGPDAQGVAVNARLTAQTGAALFVLLALEGITIVGIGRLLPEHILIGFVLIPPLLLKVGSTGYRFLRYYRRDPAYRAAGPPELAMRLLAPLLILATAVLVGSGVGLWIVGNSSILRFLHKAGFVVWFLLTSIHVLRYAARTRTLTIADFRTPLVREGLSPRRLVLVSLLVGTAVGVGLLLTPSPFLYPV